MKKTLLATLSIIYTLLTSPVYAQFFLNGEAKIINDSCYQLTDAINGQSGSIWNPTKIDLNTSFEVVMDVYLGCKDSDGADGIVFGFQPISTSIGGGGGGIGFTGVSPALGIEIDTWQNLVLNDPSFDHIAIIKNGNVDHNTSNTLAGPVIANSGQSNIEDCDFHNLRVNWNAPERILEIFFDCQLRLSLQEDIVNTIFGGDPLVFWGFTSATGGANNVHQVCFTYTTFLDQLEDVVVCPGGQVELFAKGGVTYSWTPSTGLNNPNIPNPVVKPVESTLYQVEVRDACGQPFFDEVFVEVAGDSVFFDLGTDTSLCEGQSLFLDAQTSSASYRWSNGSTEPSLTISNTGDYSVTVTKTDTFCISSDRIGVSVIPLPRISLGKDTTLCLNQSLVIGPDNAALYDLEWQDGSTVDSFLVREPGNYFLSATNRCGSTLDQITVNFEDCENVFIPNAFSPNGDGINDVFMLFDEGDVTSVLDLKVFDRWGNLVFENNDFQTNDYKAGWSGEFRGKPAASGVYLYVAELLFRNGEITELSGSIHLLR